MQAIDHASDPKVQFNVYLPKPLVIALKHRAIDEGLSMSAFVEKLARRYLEEEER